jgi:predicted phage terminase large subunit-like protein
MTPSSLPWTETPEAAGLARMSPAGLAKLATNNRWKYAPHLRLLNREIVRAAYTPDSIVVISLPPRHGKSVLASQYLPAWFLGTWPDKRVILTTYEAGFAAQWGRKARDVLTEFGERVWNIRVRDDSKAAFRWDIEGHDGGMQAVGIGGPLMGKGSDLLIVDDPVKNAEEAMSELIREKHWEWYVSTVSSRLEPGSSQVFIMHRWHRDDLVGRLVNMAEETGQSVKYIRIPALAEDNDPLGRAKGEALWPERYPVAVLERKRAVNAYWFQSLYQGDPQIKGGSLFQRAWFADKYLDSAPQADRWIRFWDLAATVPKAGSDPDWTAGALIGKTADGRFILADVRRMRGTPLDVERLVKATAEEDGKRVAIRLEQEPGSSGVNTVDHYGRVVLSGWDFKGVKTTGPKEERARPFSAACENGYVYIVRGRWVKDFLDEAEAFPMGTHDDQIDAAAGGFAELAAQRRLNVFA